MQYKLYYSFIILSLFMCNKRLGKTHILGTHTHIQTLELLNLSIHKHGLLWWWICASPPSLIESLVIFTRLCVCSRRLFPPPTHIQPPFSPSHWVKLPIYSCKSQLGSSCFWISSQQNSLTHVEWILLIPQASSLHTRAHTQARTHTPTNIHQHTNAALHQFPWSPSLFGLFRW